VRPSEHTQAVLDLMPGLARTTASSWMRDCDLNMLLLRFGQAEASEPRDGIFALLGLCGKHTGIQPDYEKPESAVVQDTISYLYNCDMRELLAQEDNDDYFFYSVKSFLVNIQSLHEKVLEVLVRRVDITSMRSTFARAQGPITITESLVKAAANSPVGLETFLAEFVPHLGESTVIPGHVLDLILRLYPGNQGYQMMRSLLEQCSRRRRHLPTRALWELVNQAGGMMDLDGHPHRPFETDTYLQWAIFLDRADLVYSLLDREEGAGMVNIVGKRGTPLIVAVRQNTPSLVHILLERHADIDGMVRGYDDPPLVAALCLEGPTRGLEDELRNTQLIVALLLENGASCDLAGIDGRRPVTAAISSSSSSHCAQLLQMLLEAGAELNYRELSGASPLIIAARRGCARCLKVLLEAGCGLESKDNKGRTALWYAANAASVDCLQLLLDDGAAFDYVDVEGHSPLWAAARTEAKPCVGLLLSAGALSGGDALDGDQDLVRAPRETSPQDERRSLRRILSGLRPQPTTATTQHVTDEGQT
jgi:ankyrin repeat protein